MTNYTMNQPNLVDPLLKQDIIEKMDSKYATMWTPVRALWLKLWHDYLKPNMWIVILFIILILFLIHRYRSVKKKREYIARTGCNPEKKTNACIKMIVDHYTRDKEHTVDMMASIVPD